MSYSLILAYFVHLMIHFSTAGNKQNAWESLKPQRGDMLEDLLMFVVELCCIFTVEMVENWFCFVGDVVSVACITVQIVKMK